MIRLLVAFSSTEGQTERIAHHAASQAEARDYFRVEDAAGRRYWLYRTGGRWFLHGLFA